MEPVPLFSLKETQAAYSVLGCEPITWEVPNSCRELWSCKALGATLSHKTREDAQKFIVRRPGELFNDQLISFLISTLALESNGQGMLTAKVGNETERWAGG